MLSNKEWDKIKNKRKGFELVDIFFKLQIFDDFVGADADGVATLFIDDLIIRLFFRTLPENRDS